MLGPCALYPSINTYLFLYFFKFPFFKVCVVCSNFVFTKRCFSFCSRVVKRLTGGKDYKNHLSHKKVRFMRKVRLGVKIRLRTKVRFGEVIFLVKVRFVAEVKLKHSSLSRSCMVFVERQSRMVICRRSGLRVYSNSRFSFKA